MKLRRQVSQNLEHRQEYSWRSQDWVHLWTLYLVLVQPLPRLLEIQQNQEEWKGQFHPFVLRPLRPQGKLHHSHARDHGHSHTGFLDLRILQQMLPVLPFLRHDCKRLHGDDSHRYSRRAEKCLKGNVRSKKGSTAELTYQSHQNPVTHPREV